MRMPDMDKALHIERAIRGGGKVTFDALLSELPVGAMFEHDGLAFLLSAQGALPWSFDGYGTPRAISNELRVRVLTPRSIVKTFCTGFQPILHESAERGS